MQRFTSSGKEPAGSRTGGAGPYDAGMTVTRRVTVERNRLRFAAAHMATFRGTCEPLHGHNYDIFIELEGELAEDSWVWDFGEMKRMARELADALDHKFLLQRESRHLRITEMDDAWEVGFETRTYRFPKSDVAVLPIDNTTVERLSEWMAGQLAPALRGIEGGRFAKLTVGLEEMPGQAGWYTVDL